MKAPLAVAALLLTVAVAAFALSTADGDRHAALWADLPAGWSRLPPPPFARTAAAVAWTGAELLVWGGEDSLTERARGGGAAFDARSRRWRRIPPAPIRPRAWAASAWTGRELVVWSGGERDAAFDGGAAYDPMTDRWRRIARAPIGARRSAAAVWTGKELVVWGGTGRAGAGRLRDGAAYDPAADRWRRVTRAPLVLDPASAAWMRRAPLDPVECTPESARAGRTILVVLCGQAALFKAGRWKRLRPPRDIGTPIAAGPVFLVVGRSLWAYRPP